MKKVWTDCWGPGQRLPCGFILLLLRAWHPAAHPHCGWPPSGRCPSSKPRESHHISRLRKERPVPQYWRPAPLSLLMGNTKAVTVMSSTAFVTASQRYLVHKALPQWPHDTRLFLFNCFLVGGFGNSIPMKIISTVHTVYSVLQLAVYNVGFNTDVKTIAIALCILY